MANLKGPTEGGSGGKRGHSNMEHWVPTEEIKAATKIKRRSNQKKIIRQEMDEIKHNSATDY